LAEKNCSVSALRDSYPKYIISKNKIELTPAINVDQLLEKMISAYSTNEIDTTDGVKIYFDKEWVHLRKSNTEPIIRIYSESQNKEKAEELAQNIISQIKSLIA
jgi:phosphomannomutase